MSVLEDEERLPFLHGTLKIHVIEARDLPNTDNAFFNIDRGDVTDPFVTISLGEVPLLKTAYLPNTLDPRWDEKFSIPVCHRASCFKVHSSPLKGGRSSTSYLGRLKIGGEAR